MWDGVNSHSSMTKSKLESALADSDQFLFLRTTNSELRVRGNNNSVRQWCAWEIGNYYTKHKDEKYYTSIYDRSKSLVCKSKIRKKLTLIFQLSLLFMWDLSHL